MPKIKTQRCSNSGRPFTFLDEWYRIVNPDIGAEQLSLEISMNRTIGKIIFALALMLVAINGYAQKNEHSYNVQRAMECLAEGELDTSYDYVEKELENNPKNPEALHIGGLILVEREEYGRALTALNKALQCYKSKEKNNKASVYFLRSKVYCNLLDTLSAINDLQTALKLNPQDRDYSIELGELFYKTNRNEEAIAIYTNMMKLDEGDLYPYYGLARCAYKEERYEDALKLVASARRLDPQNTMNPIMEMRVARFQKDPSIALNKAVETFELDMRNQEAYECLMWVLDTIPAKAKQAVERKILVDQENTQTWQLLLGTCYMHTKEYDKAVATFLPISSESSAAKYYLLECYDEMDDPEKVVEQADIVLEIYPEDAFTLIRRGSAKFYMQDLEGAKADYELANEYDADYGYYVWYRLGWIAEMQKDYTKALEYYNKGILLNETYAYTYVMKGNLLKDYLNQPDEARLAFEAALQNDTIAEDGCCLQYAYIGLGQPEKAIETMNAIIALNPNNAGNYYDAACVYSRLKMQEEAIASLRKALELGYKKYRHIEADDDLDFIKNTPEFLELMEEFKSRKGKNVTEEAAVETIIHEIPLVRQASGTYLVKASVNGLPMDFILDTGASSVSVSQVESDFMLKNGYLKTSDVKGNSRYVDAQGETHTEKSVKLRSIKIGEIEVSDIRAGVVSNQKAPLLLGQSVLERFGKVEIDHTQNILRITIVKNKKSH